ncbi:MAG: PAS domain-containing protein [Deltaproteobacteria bacterium]|nr:PAS domain-containing protein [Deltaproteobacteria bacterium]
MRKEDQMDSGIKEQILEQIPTPVMAVNTELEIIYMNAAGRGFLGKSWEEIRGYHCYELFESKHCQTPECRMRQAIENEESRSGRNEIPMENRTVYIEYYAVPLRDEKKNIIGGLEFIVDITEKVRDERRLEEQSRTIREISTPAIELWDRVLVLPVLGVIDSMRAQQMTDTMLNKIKETSSKVIILDIQGVAAVDTAVANHLIKITKATRLMGCQCIISGISPAVANTIVQLGIDMGDIKTNSTLREALVDSFAMLNLEVTGTTSVGRRPRI